MQWQPLSIMNKLYSVLHKCEYFNNIPEEKYPNVLKCLQASERMYEKGATIIHIGEPAKVAGVVIDGTVELAFWDENGNQINVNHISSGEVFGAAIACLKEQESPVQIQALTDCRILFLNFNSLLDMQEPLCPYRMRVATNLLRSFAQQAMFLNQKIRIISQKRLRDKVKLYLQHEKIDENGRVVLKFSRNEMADYLCVDRSALSRELSRMKNEGILLYQGQEFQIIDENFFD